MDIIDQNKPEKINEKNIFKQDGREYVRKIKKCTCLNKQGGIYALECRIMERGWGNYSYKEGDKCLTRMAVKEKSLWLCDEAFENVSEEVAAFEELVIKAGESFKKVYVEKYGFYMYYQCVKKERYDFILKFEKDQGIGKHDVFVFRSITVADLLKEVQVGSVWHYLNTDIRDNKIKCCAEDPVYTAVAGKDEILERLFRLYNKEESSEDLRFLSANVFEADILPHLPEEYDREYYVIKESIPNYDLLERSGYSFWHRPFAMPGNSREAVTLNPHTKKHVDAVPETGEKITYEEYLKLFEKYL